VASLIYHATAEAKQPQPDMALLNGVELANEMDLLMAFPAARRTAVQTAVGFLERGLGALFVPEHQALIQPVIRFIARQIGADRFFPDAPE
jgi:hypothetical protein